MRALVADDEVTTRMMLEGLMSTWGYDVVAVADGDAAWAILSSDDPPRIAVVDWMMPGLDGVEICRRLRQASEGHYIYTVLITHRDRADDLMLALEAGADDLARKPIDAGELKSRLAVGKRLAAYDERLGNYARDMEALAESRAKQLLHADRMATLGVLSAGVAHEVSNPATFISGNVQTLRRFWDDIEVLLKTHLRQGNDEFTSKLKFIIDETPKALGGIHGGVKRITKIVEGLNAYAGQRDTAREACDLDACVSKALDLCGHRLKKAGVLVSVDIPEGFPKVHADAGQVEQVFVNLLVNASDAMAGRTQDELHIRAFQEEGRIRVSVEDSGPGIPEDILARIWEPFFTTKEMGKGSGLGLAICRSIIEDHGGTLNVANRPDGGAVFSICLPPIDMPKEAPNVKAAAPPPTPVAAHREGEVGA